MINEIDSESLHRRIAGGEDVLLVDIRTPAEIAQGAIPGAMQVPMHLIPIRISELPKDRDVVLYCRSGARSYQACAYMLQQGYDRVLNLRGDHRLGAARLPDRLSRRDADIAAIAAVARPPERGF